jgi:magnesium transporter
LVPSCPAATMRRVQVLTSLDDPDLDRLLTTDEFFWLDLEGPDEADVRRVGERFGLHPLAIEDSLEFGQRPKIDDYGDAALLVFYGAHEDGRPVEIHLHVSGGWMLTVRQTACKAVHHAFRRLEREAPRTEEEAIYRLLDALTDSFFPVLERMDSEIDDLMDAMLDGPRTDQRQRLFDMRRQLVDLRRIIAPQRDMLARGGDLLGRLPGLEADDARDWFRDIYDHLLRIAELIDSYRDLLAGALDVYLSTVSNRVNDISKQLTIVATIFLPLTFVTGFFGQNFGTLVRHIDSPAAFWGYGVGGMLVSGLILLAWFKRSGFLDA